MTAALRALGCALVLLMTPATLAAPAFHLIGDELDPKAIAATLPRGPVDRALAQAREDSEATEVLVATREGERGGVRYALAAWRSAPGAAGWDAMLVLALPEGARLLEASGEGEVEAGLAALLDHAFGSAAPTPRARTQAALPLPTEWETRFVVLLMRNPDYAAPSDPAEVEALTQAHIQYTLTLQRDGTAQAAGPFTETADGVVGMTLLRAPDLATAERIAAADPAVAAGRLKAVVREWSVPAGKLR